MSVIFNPDFHPVSNDPSRHGQTIPVAFNKPAFIGYELEEVQRAIVNHRHISGAGYYTRHCESLLADLYATPVLLVTSCTHALEMSAHLLNLGPEDEVILPSYTFVSTANAFALKGCRLKFADCDAYGQICLDSVQRLVTERTKAVCVVHYAGNSTDMDALLAICQEHQLYLVEDAAQAIGTRYKGRLLGTWGDVACLSFHETKNVTSGEGGALILNRRELLERAHVLREKGTNRTQFFQGLVDKYTWVDIGSSYVMSDMNAAYLFVQLQHLDDIQAKRAQLWERYYRALLPLLPGLNARLFENAPGCDPNYHLFALVFHQPEDRPAFIRFMKERDIVAPFHYVALHDSPMGQAHYPVTETMPGTAALASGLVRLPLFYNMTELEQDCVIHAVQDYATRMLAV